MNRKGKRRFVKRVDALRKRGRLDEFDLANVVMLSRAMQELKAAQREARRYGEMEHQEEAEEEGDIFMRSVPVYSTRGKLLWYRSELKS